MKEIAKQLEISKILGRLLIESRNHGHVYLPVGLREELQRLTLKELQQTEFHVSKPGSKSCRGCTRPRQGNRESRARRWLWTGSNRPHPQRICTRT